MRVIFLLLMTFLAFSCQKNDLEGLEESSSVSLRVKTDFTEHEVALTRAGGVLPTLNDFMVRIENTRAEVLKVWDYDSLPNLIKVVPGSYKLVAEYGTDTILPAFDSPYYYGERKITLKEGDNLDTTVVASSAAAKVKVVFDNSFALDYADYYVDIKTAGSDTLRYSKTEQRTGYFKPGNLRMRFGLKIKGESVYRYYYTQSVTQVKGRESYNMTLKARTSQGSLEGITITTDTTTILVDVAETLPSTFLPKKAPMLKFSGEGVVSDQVNTTEGVARPVAATVISAAGLKGLKLKTTTAGWLADVDLMNMTLSQKQELQNHGLVWSDVLETQDSIKSMVSVRFNDAVKLLTTAPNTTSDFSFVMEAIDIFNQVSKDTLHVQVAPPVFQFEVNPGVANVFARRVVYDVKYVSDVREPIIEYAAAGGGSWNALTTTSRTKGNDTYECTGTGLQANTQYQLRVRLGEHTISAGTHTTEQDMQVPNGNMEQWYLETKKNWIGQKTHLYRTWAQGETSPWWANNNQRSTWWTTAPTDYNSAPAVSYLNERSGKVAEIRTTGSGSGYANTGAICYEGSRIPGMLFIGDYTYDKTNETINYGRPFASRPMALKFWYHYTPYNNEEFEAYIEVQNRDGGATKVLATGVLKSAQGTTDYVQANVELNYTDRTLKATHIYIRFLSSTAKTPAVQASTINLEGIKNNWGAHVGSRLKVDDIELVY